MLRNAGILTNHGVIVTITTRHRIRFWLSSHPNMLWWPCRRTSAQNRATAEGRSDALNRLAGVHSAVATAGRGAGRRRFVDYVGSRWPSSP